MTCATCTGRDLLGTTAHYAWCDLVGGSGIKPGSVRALQADYRRRVEEKAQREAEAAAEAQRKRETNNGWVKFDGDQRTYSHIVESPARRDFEEQLELTVQRFERDSAPVARDKRRPGKELSKYWREIATKLVDEQGWDYDPTKNHPRLIPPTGGMGVSMPKTVTEGHSGHRRSYLTALKRAGAVLDGVA